MSQQIQRSKNKEEQKSKSEREKVNEYIASMAIEKEQGYLNAIFKDLFVLPTFGYTIRNHRRGNKRGTISALNHIPKEEITNVGWISISYICKLYVPTRDKNLYVRIDTEELYDVFSDNFTVSNIFDQALVFNEPDSIKLNIVESNKTPEENNVKFKQGSKFSYTNSLEQSINSSGLDYGHYSSHNDVISFDKFISNTIFDEILLKYVSLPDNLITTQKIVKNHINDEFKWEKNKLKKKCVNKEYLDGHIADCEVDTDIKLYIESESVSSEEPLKFTYAKPSDSNSKFLDLINEFNVNSISELEMQPVTLCRRNKPFEWSKDSNGWYISTQKSNFKKSQEKTIHKLNIYYNKLRQIIEGK